MTAKKLRHREPEIATQPPAESSRADWSRASGGIVLFVSLAVVWGGLLFTQPLTAEVSRWMLFLVPDATVASWFDGPVSAGGLLARLPVLLVALAVMAIATLGGWVMLRKTKVLEGLRRVEQIVLMTTLGLALQSSATLAVGLLGWFQSPWMVPAVTLGTICLGLALRRLALTSSQNITVEDSTEEAGSRFARWALLPVIGLLLARAILPPAEYDVREYHLQAPKEWWLAGGIDFMPHNIYANMPLGAELHTVTAMAIWELAGSGIEDAWWWGALSGKVILASFVAFTACLCGAALRRLLIFQGSTPNAARWSGDWLTLLVVAFPALLEGGSLGLVEAAIAALAAAGLLVAIQFAARNKHSDADRNFTAAVVWVSVAAGGAIACKYPAVVFVVPTLLAALGWASWVSGGFARDDIFRHSSNRAIATSLLRFAVGTLCVGGLWYAKNLWLAGNPVYPLLGDLLGGRTLTAEKIAQWNAGHRPPGYQVSEMGYSLAGLLWRWRLQGWCLLPLAGLAVVYGWRQREVRLLVSAIAAAVLMWWCITHRVDRFLLPLSPLLFLLAGIGLWRLRELAGATWAAGLVGVLCGFNLFYIAGPALGDSRLAVDLDYLRRDDQSASSISRLAPHVPWVNRELPADSRLLVVGDAAVFDYEIRIAYATTFDESPLLALTTGEPSEWRSQFAAAGFTHVLVHWGEIERLRSTYGFAAEIDRQLFERLVAMQILQPLQLDDVGGAVEIYQVRK
ncbi:hypothetical protein SH139x_000915 [Planctomycetaceae bacterium SH139]